MVSKETEEEKSETKQRYEIIEVPVQTTLAIRDNNDKEKVLGLRQDQGQALIEIMHEVLNKVNNIENNTG